MNVSVCVSTNCYLRGSYDILNRFTELIKEFGLEKHINLGGTFCLGTCDKGVSIRVDDEIITGVTKENADQIFRTKIALKVDIS